MKDEFLATVSHELRTPLNAILGWTVTARAKATPEIDRALEIVERNARTQARLIEDVLDVSRVVSGKLRIDPTDVVLEEVILASVDAVRQAAQAKGIDLDINVPERAQVRVDGQRLQQVVWNLLSNAIKFTPKGGRVTIEAVIEPSALVLTVRDTGEGIDPAFLPHIFEPFRQADASTTRRHGGLGLGLAIVKQIVDAHGGTIVPTSGGRGQGAVFRLELPREPRTDSIRARALDRASVPVDPEASLEGLTVLVVDDDPDARLLLASALGDRGAEVVTAASAGAAFDEIVRVRPDIVVSDIAMPGGDGYGLMRAVRGLAPERGGRTPAIAVTAHARSIDGERAYAAGFQAHLAKPVDIVRLVSLVRGLAGTSIDVAAT
jgi:CheY-like chemotaxis protein